MPTSTPTDAPPPVDSAGPVAPDQTEMAYPAETQAPPPVLPPVGKGLEVPLQKYIVVDQFGYRPELTKVAVLADPKSGWNAPDAYTPPAELQVRAWTDNSVVFKGAPSVWNGGAVDAAAGDRGSWFDFTALKTPGLYYVFDPVANVRSHPFSIGVDVYEPVLKTALRMYYFNRANVAKRPPHSCVGRRCWSAAADNLGEGQDREARSVTERDNPKTARNFVGGWWDAGDTNKYTTFTNDAVHQLLTAYTERPSAFGDDFNIPESGNGLPDIIDEVLVELELLKKMQPADLKGGALLKVGYVDYAFPLPELSQLKRYYYPKPCSSATIVLAGEFAHAAIVLEKFPKLQKDAADLAERSKKAWRFYHENPKSDACDDGTIKSGDADQTIEQQNQIAVTAAVYLFALTGAAEYGDYVRKHYEVTRPFKDDLFSVYFPSQGDALLYYARLPNADPAVRSAIQARKVQLSRSSDIFGTKPERSLYRGYIRKDMFHWASNNARASAANTNYDLAQYELVSSAERPAFVERAADLLHWFHGVNAMQLVYLTNMYADGGDACADETYHAWFKDGHPKWDNARTSELGPAPGYLTGGPNLQYCAWQNPAEHACAKSPIRRQPAEKAYLDGNRGHEPDNAFDKSWELTEPAIYYQASYVRLVSKFVD